MMKYHRTSMLIDLPTRDALVRAAAEEGQSVSQYVRNLIARQVGTPLAPIYSRTPVLAEKVSA